MISRPTAASGLMAEAESYWTPRRRNLVLAILCVVGLFNFVDRQVITVLLQPIKEEFHASDTQMGFLTGLAFAAFYALAGIPIARLADVRTRKMVIAVCLAFWSLMTTLGGAAVGFWMLAGTRIGVAVGEAGAAPTSQSILMDLFPLNRRAVVLGLLSGTQSLGIGLGVFLGGWLSQAFGWRAAFLIVGAPGLLLALIVYLWVREPPRGFSEPVRAEQAPPPPLGQVIRRLFSTPSYVLSLATVGLGGLGGYGMLNWGPTFMVRIHHMSAAQVGTWIGAAIAGSLFLGIMSSSMIADWAARKDMRAYPWIAAIGPLVAIPPGLWFVSEHDWRFAVAAYFLMTFAQCSHNTLSYVIGQTVSPVRMRAVSSVIMGLVTTLVGIGIGPFAIGVLNDLLEPRYGTEAVRYSLSFITLGWLGAAVTATLASFYIRSDYARLQQEIADAAAAAS